MDNNRFMQIIPPEGYEIDKDKSTFERIVFKPIAGRWRDNTKAFIKGYYISLTSGIVSFDKTENVTCNYHIFATKAQAKSALAMARISQIMANDERFGGIVTNEDWGNYDYKYTICYNYVAKQYYLNIAINTKTFLAFHTKGQATLFMEENEDLLNDYFMI